MIRTIAAVFLLALVTGCSADLESVNQPPQLSAVGSGLSGASGPAAVADAPPFAESQSGWTGGSADYFRDARARRTGDIITVKIAINDSATLNNTSNRSRKSSADGSLSLGYDLMGISTPAAGGSHQVASNSASTGQGSTVRSEQIDLAVAAIVTSVLPNGYLVIEGSQEVAVNFEQRTLRVAGIVHPGDITPDNAISYEKIAEARISYGGKGRLTEVQQPGWAQQIWDKVSPF